MPSQAPATSPQKTSPGPGSFAQGKQEIENILKETGLPERSEFHAEDTKKKEEVRFDTTLGAQTKEATLTPAQVPASPPPANQPQKKKDDAQESSIITPLRTLKNDLQNIVRTNKISLVHAAALEQEKKRGQPKKAERAKHSSRMRTIVFATLTLLVVGSAALVGVAILSQEPSDPTKPSAASSILFAENAVLVSLEGTSAIDTKRSITDVRARTSGTLGSVTQLTLTVPEENPARSEETLSRPATLEEFFTAIGARSSPDLLRALSNEFFFGVHTVDENAPVLVVPVLSYERAFAGMLAWEEMLNVDLSPIYTAVPTQTIGESGLPERRRFEDVVMRNYDVRALRDDSGEIQLYYAFPTRDLLIIGESSYSFAEVLNRLRAERRL